VCTQAQDAQGALDLIDLLTSERATPLRRTGGFD
jgi:hypothetical protein